MHLARSEQHFEALGDLGGLIMKAHNEEEAWAWFSKQYCEAPYNGWWIGASEEIGVTPNNNPLEAYWRAMKGHMCTGTRVGHTKLITYVFPHVLFLTACDYCGPPDRGVHHLAGGSLSGAAELLKIRDDSGGLMGIKQRTDLEESEVSEHCLCNALTTVQGFGWWLNAQDAHNVHLTGERIEVFMQMLYRHSHTFREKWGAVAKNNKARYYHVIT